MTTKMRLSTNKKREDVAASIRSILMTSQEGITIRKLEKDYEEVLYQPIPYKEFNCQTLYIFLKQLHDYVRMERVGGQTLLFPKECEKSKHVTDLVQNQRSNKRGFKKPYLGHCATKPQVNIPPDLLMQLVSSVHLCPQGLPINYAINFVNQFIFPVQITRQQLEQQLSAMSHQVVVRGDNLYPVYIMPLMSLRPRPNTPCVYNPSWQLNGGNFQISKVQSSNVRQRNPRITAPVQLPPQLPPQLPQPQLPQPQLNKSGNKLPLVNEGADNVYKPNDEFLKLAQNKLPLVNKVADNVYAPNDKLLKQNGQTEKKPDCTTNFQHPCPQENESASEKSSSDRENCKENLTEPVGDLSTLTKIRLSKLIHDLPNGIWCSELSRTYLEKYKSPLTFPESSVLHCVSKLPNIFHCVRPLDEEDYKLFNARNCLPYVKNDKEASHLEDFAHELDLDDFKLALLKEVMGIKETVKQISATEFKQDVNDYLEVIISHVISPSFFWIHMRNNLPSFKAFVNAVKTYYENNSSKYRVPYSLLQKGLNVVCFFQDRWNRGLIKEVCEDLQVDVFFYDYGIEKKCFSDEIYFLHRSFSNFPAQAIPCSLFNVKPYQTSEWSRDIIWKFISKTSFPLIATVHEVDLEENLLYVILTDTRTDEDFHINDWLYSEKFGEAGQCTLNNHNFVFSHYKESLKQKGYDPLSLHDIRSKSLKLSGVDVEATNHVKISPFESGNKISEQCQPRVQKLLALYAKSQVSVDTLPPLKQVTAVAEDKNSTESPVKSSCSKLLFLQKMNNLVISDCNGSSEAYEDRNKPSTSNAFNSSSCSSDTISTFSLEESPKISTELSYFGTFGSECGGRGKMGPIDWEQALKADKKKQQHQDEIPIENSALEQEEEELKDVPPQVRRLLKLQNKFKK